MVAISSLEVFPLREPVSRRAYTVVRLRTDAGPDGFGECGQVPPAELEQARRILIGRDPTAYEALRRELAPPGSLQAGVNMALLDFAGKQAKAPVYQVLGGPTRNKVRVMAAVTSDALAEEARRAGFRAVMIPAGAPKARNQGQAFVDSVRRRLEALRRAMPDMDFVLDGAGRLTPGDAASLAAAFERFHLLWLEEPCKISNLAALRKIAGETVTPLGFGREIQEPGPFQDLLREQAIDVLRPDIARNGISAIRRMAALAEAYYVAVAPFHQGGPISTAAALQLAASLPNFFIQQIPFAEAEEDRRMRAELAGGSLETARDGYAALPSGPGLGFTVSEAALEKYR